MSGPWGIPIEEIGQFQADVVNSCEHVCTKWESTDAIDARETLVEGPCDKCGEQIKGVYHGHQDDWCDQYPEWELVDE